MKLYYAPGACSLAPHIVLTEAGLTTELVKVDLKNKIANGENYLAINPKGSVPALQLDNGTVLTEAVAIMQYLADQKPQTQLMPADHSWQKYQALEWLNFIATEVHKGFSPLWNPENSDEVKERTKQNLFKKFNLANAHLEKNQFILGNQFTIADAYLFTVINWSSMVKIDLTPWPFLKKFMETVRSRPAVITALKEEGLIPS